MMRHVYDTFVCHFVVYLVIWNPYVDTEKIIQYGVLYSVLCFIYSIPRIMFLPSLVIFTLDDCHHSKNNMKDKKSFFLHEPYPV